MGNYIHRALIVHGMNNRAGMSAVEDAALCLELEATRVASLNGLETIYVAPSGAKHDWEDYASHKEKLNKLKELIRVEELHWFEVEFGDINPRVIGDGPRDGAVLYDTTDIITTEW